MFFMAASHSRRITIMCFSPVESQLYSIIFKLIKNEKDTHFGVDNRLHIICI